MGTVLIRVAVVTGKVIVARITVVLAVLFGIAVVTIVVAVAIVTIVAILAGVIVTAAVQVEIGNRYEVFQILDTNASFLVAICRQSLIIYLDFGQR